jgi:hypothetical protein
MCIFFAPRDTPDTHTKETRITSVVSVTQNDPTVTGVNKKYLHHKVFSNTKTWDLHPYASPEGPGTPPSENCQGWSTARSLGAAMRLTALRQPPTDSPRPMNPRPKSRKTHNKALPHSHTYYCKLPSPESVKTGRTVQYTPQGYAVRSTIMYYPLPELTTRISGTRRERLLLNPELNTHSPQILLPTGTRNPSETYRPTDHGNEMRPLHGGSQSGSTPRGFSDMHLPNPLHIR